MQANRSLPQAMIDAPTVNPGLELFWSAFWDLVSCRAARDMAIPWTAVQMWANTHCLSRDTAADLHYLVRALDGAFLDFMRKQKPETPQGGK